MYYKLPLRKLTDKITAQIILAANYLKTSSLSTQLPRDSLKNSKNGKKGKNYTYAQRQVKNGNIGTV